MALRLTRRAGAPLFFHRQGRYSHHSTANFVKIVEVGPRDGLQNESTLVPAPVKLGLIQRLAASNISVIEAASFVSAKWVPAMADAEQVIQGLSSAIRWEAKTRRPHFPVLVPNKAGLERALATGLVEEIAVFTAASESFSRKNTNCSIEESLQRIAEVARLALGKGIRVRGYVSCAVGCPYEGWTEPLRVLDVTHELIRMGCYEVSLGDTIGVATAGHIRALLQELKSKIPVEKLAVHCHDTYGQALANILMALEHGVRTVDSSVAGLGGCPFAPGASGNVATEDVVYMLHGLGYDTGINMARLLEAGRYICDHLKRPPSSRASRAFASLKPDSPYAPK